ncbi:MAG TPA: cytochrome b, partial [Caulobacteraceae bacterium]|nr:cytochrome b [Caulobacteraceae bacterium]
MTHAARAAEGARYSTVAILLHWTIAALIVLQVVLGLRMGERTTPEAFAVFQLHKSVGITILLLSLARLAWRLIHRPPPEPATLAPWERSLATAVHWAFYIVMLGMPLTGWIMVSTSRVVLPTLLYGAIPWPHLPVLPELAGPEKAVWFNAAKTSHLTIILGAGGLLALHVAGALK